jgi:CRISPR/Cas system-associated protein endoribonuclease Cas2
VTISCPNHGVFEQNANSHLYGQGCPSCINKTEGILQNWLHEFINNYNVNLLLITQKTFANLKSAKGKLLRFDFMIGNVVIELDGDQHFRDVSNWDTCSATQNKDILKTEYLIKNGYSLIRIYQPWVYSNSNNWKESMKDSITQLLTTTTPVIHYIGDNVYDSHKELLSIYM